MRNSRIFISVKVYFFFSIMYLFFSDCHALAEHIFIQLKNGSEGHGWLFGAYEGEQCWIAVPAHVVASPETGKLEPFIFFDSSGNSGESGIPVNVSGTKHNSVAERESSDLAFARVLAGRSDGQCHSRLGLFSYAYQTMLTQTSGFTGFSMLKTSKGTFDVTLDRRSVDSLGGVVLEFKINGQQAKALRRGLSGTTIMSNYKGMMQPVAMALRVDENNGLLRCLRYDYIKKLFNNLKLADDISFDRKQSSGYIDYKIVQAKYKPSVGDSGLSSLKSESGCWRATAQDNQNLVELVIAVPKDAVQVKTLEINQNNSCYGDPVKYWVEYRNSSNEAWVYAAKGASKHGGTDQHYIGLSCPKEFRITFDASNPIVLSGIRLR